MTQTERRLIKATAQAVGWLMIDAREKGFGSVGLRHVDDYDEAKAGLFAAIRDMGGAIAHADDAAFMEQTSGADRRRAAVVAKKYPFSPGDGP